MVHLNALRLKCFSHDYNGSISKWIYAFIQWLVKQSARNPFVFTTADALLKF